MAKTGRLPPPPGWIEQFDPFFGGSKPTITTGATPVAQQTVSLPKGILPIEFSLVDVGGTVTDSQLYRILGGSGGAIAVQLSYTVPFRGSIVAMSLAATTAKTAGTASFAAFRQGVDTGASLVWATSADSGFQGFQVGQYPFAAGDPLDIRVTTASFTPTTADVEVFLYLAQDVT